MGLVVGQVVELAEVGVLPALRGRPGAPRSAPPSRGRRGRSAPRPCRRGARPARGRSARPSGRRRRRARAAAHARVASQNRRKSHAISGAGGGVSASRAARTASRSSLFGASRRTSRSGQYVMPSPYERQRPQSAVTPLARRTSSAASRDLPTPGGPTTRATRGDASSSARFSGLAESRELALPADKRRVQPALERRRDRRELDEPVGAHRLPLALDLEARPEARARRRGRSAGPRARRSTISPVAAPCSSLAAMPTASPVTSRCRASVGVATTSPVSMPIRTLSPTPCSCRSCSSSAAIAARMSSAARAARSASSSCETGMPKAAMTASPAYFSTVPPWRSSTADTVSK